MLEGISTNIERNENEPNKAYELRRFCLNGGNEIKFKPVKNPEYGENFELRKMDQNKLVSRKIFCLF